MGSILPPSYYLQKAEQFTRKARDADTPDLRMAYEAAAREYLWRAKEAAKAPAS
jgi:hypothetical protein